MPAERLSMRQIREVLRLCFESRLPQRGGGPEPWAEPGRGVGLFEPGAGGGHSLAVGRRSRRFGARSGAVSAILRDAGRSASDTRLGLGAPRTAPSRRDAGAAVGGVPRRRRRRVRLFLVLRSLP